MMSLPATEKMVHAGISKTLHNDHYNTFRLILIAIIHGKSQQGICNMVRVYYPKIYTITSKVYSNYYQKLKQSSIHAQNH